MEGLEEEEKPRDCRTFCSAFASLSLELSLAFAVDDVGPEPSSLGRGARPFAVNINARQDRLIIMSAKDKEGG